MCDPNICDEEMLELDMVKLCRKVTKVHAESWGHAIVAVTQLYVLLLKNLKDV